MTELLFSFGTLQLPDVQKSLFGREVPSRPDSLVGCVVGTVTIVDPAVIELSGTDQHPGLERTGNPDDTIGGVVLEVSELELAAADHYERVSYERVPVVLVSGTAAWVYVPRSS